MAEAYTLPKLTCKYENQALLIMIGRINTLCYVFITVGMIDATHGAVSGTVFVHSSTVFSTIFFLEA